VKRPADRARISEPLRTIHNNDHPESKRLREFQLPAPTVGPVPLIEAEPESDGLQVATPTDGATGKVRSRKWWRERRVRTERWTGSV
jgi:hypothetical protein